MEEKTEEKTEEKSENKFPVDYDEKIISQAESVKKITASHSKNPSAETELELDRELDLLRHYENAAKEEPKERAAAVAELAKRIAINRAVQQMPVE